MTRVKRTGKNETIIFRNAASVLTFDFDDTVVFDSTSALVLGLRKNEDVVVVDGVVAAIGADCAQKFLSNANVTESDARSY